MSDPIIVVENLCRSFGAVQAVQDVSFEVHRGQAVGFIGANGAGKTTTMRMMATLDLPTRGRIALCGLDVLNYPYAVRRRIGWMPDSYGSYEYMSVFEYLDFYARAFGFRGADRARRIDEVMDFADLKTIATRPMKTLSKGMAQRLCLGRTLIHDPEVLILDEPAAGLDPRARLEFKQLVRLLAGEGKTLFISSHILSELEEMCDVLLFIDQGRIVHHGTADSLKQKQHPHVLVEVLVAGDPERLRQWVDLNPGVRLVDMLKQGARLQLESGAADDLVRMLRKMVTDGVPVVDFHRQAMKLEDAFVDLLGQSGGN